MSEPDGKAIAVALFACTCDTGFYSQNAHHEQGCRYGAVLPAQGERPVFGHHRLPVAERSPDVVQVEGGLEL